MATKKKKVYKNYQDYLNSSEWQKLRELNHSRVKREYDLEELECEICTNCESDHEMHVHHFIYPKDWNDDKMEYHVVLCKECHDKIHDKDSFVEEYLNAPSNRLQFIRSFNDYLSSIATNLLCDEHSEKQDLEKIVVNALKIGLIKYEAEYKKGYNDTYFWRKHILGVSLIPPVEDRLIASYTNLKKE